jgi:sugar phosphate isomerase/epimerase
MSYTFRHAICNEAFEKFPFRDACQAIRKAGYAGIEIAPFTLAEDPATIPPAKRREFRSIIESEGLRFVGLHWLMVSPKGLHVTTPDASLRARSWRHIQGLIDLFAQSTRDHRRTEPGRGHAQLSRWPGFSGAARCRTRSDDSG